MTQVQILDKAVCISFYDNTLEKDMDPTILPPAMDKQEGRLGILVLVQQPVSEKENSKFKPALLWSKNHVCVLIKCIGSNIVYE